MKQTLSTTLVGLALCGLAAAPAAAGPLATLATGPTSIEWQPALSGAGLTFTVSGPEGFYLREELAPGQSPSFSVFDTGGNHRPAGAYVWELRPVFTLDEGTRAQLGAAREGGDDVALRKAAGLPAGHLYQSGSFSIVGGEIVAADRSEPTPGDAGGGNRLAAKATVLTTADGVIRNSLCVGFDCPNSPSFSDTTILMMENNTRIKFDDTSSTASFPDNDWEIEANSSLNGGAEYLGFNDCGNSSQGGCATDLVFAVEAGTRTSALYVESDGDVGMGTSNPVVTLHIVDGNTPTLRLDQDGSAGFTPQVWDVAGNETNFFIRDATGGSQLPFRIQPGADTNSVFIDVDGEVGIGTSAPADELHVDVTGGNGGVLITSDTNLPQLTIDNEAVASDDGVWRFRVNSTGNFVFTHADSDSTTPFVIEPESNTNLVTLSGNTLEVDGNITATGTITPDYVFEPDFPLESIADHAEWMWTNKHLPAVGPAQIREDGKHVFNLSVHTFGMLEELEKAHIYIAQLNERLEAKGETVAALEESNARLSAEQRALEAQLEELKAVVEELADRR